MNLKNLYDIAAIERMKKKGEDVPAKVLNACKKAMKDNQDEEKDTDPKDIKTIDDFMEAFFKDRMEPGPEWKSDVKPAEIKPAGKADGVIYFAGVQNSMHQKKGAELKWKIRSMVNEAFRYLKEASVMARVEFNSPDGLASIAVGKLFMDCPPIHAWREEILGDAEKTGVPLKAYFKLSQRSIDAVQPAHCCRWVVRKAQDGIWCLFYI